MRTGIARASTLQARCLARAARDSTGLSIRRASHSTFIKLQPLYSLLHTGISYLSTGLARSQQGAVDVADYAAQAGIPVIRFTDSDASLHPALELPAVLALTGAGPCPLTGEASPHQRDPGREGRRRVPRTGGAVCALAPAVMMEAERLLFRGMESLPALEAAVLRAWRRPPPPPGACALPTDLQSMVWR